MGHSRTTCSSVMMESLLKFTMKTKKPGPKTGSKRKMSIKLRMPKSSDEEEGIKGAKRRKRKVPLQSGGTKKKARRSPASRAGKDELMVDPELIEREYNACEDGFEAARANLTKRGRWTLPTEIKSNFQEVALITLTNISKYDEYNLFADKVDENELPDYYDAIQNPMDFKTMRAKVQSGGYGSGDAAVGALYDDFLLAFDNCEEYNGQGEVLDASADVVKALPLVFFKAI